MRFNAPRMAQASAWLLARQGSMDPPQLMHYLYLAERKSVLTHGALIVGGTIIATEFGPVHETALHQLLGLAAEEGQLLSWISLPVEHPGLCTLASHLNAQTVGESLGLLSCSDEECLAWAIEHGTDLHELSNMQGAFEDLLPEWNQSMLHGTSLSLQHILMANGSAESSAEALVAHLREMDDLNAVFDGSKLKAACPSLRLQLTESQSMEGQDDGRNDPAMPVHHPIEAAPQSCVTKPSPLGQAVKAAMDSFRVWAVKQGLPLELTDHEGPRFKQTKAGRNMATFLDDATEGAWRAWAHLSLASVVSRESTPSKSASSDAGGTSGYGLSTAESHTEPNAG